ncbi:MAG: hypothetical protein P4L91_00685 [Burkholderiaceae bacterium]|nr:hypothetical protein [Burkholderiaceae bacterium]
MNTRHFLICLMLMLTAVTAFAAPRTFPSTALRGTLSAAVHPQIKIDGQIKTLSPGAKILSKQNTIIMSTSLMDNSYTVNYTVDRQGYVDKVWILTDEELAKSQ